MMNNILKVYDEDLANGDLASASISGQKPVNVGMTSGALVVNVFAKGDVTLSNEVSISVKQGDTKDGGFKEAFTIVLEAGKSFKDGDLMASATISEKAKAYMVADVVSNEANSGGIRVTLGYLAR
ncbi:MAG: hypothetical protein E7005_01630 [Alphaproteobacteria bacterium]|nr:hypothetical protein [Alphaproteobacteria bacterium]